MEKWKIGWGISNRCNMRCGFCYSRKARQETDFHDIIREGLRLIRENKDRIESVNFGTGEPALVPELFELCEAIRKEAPHISIGITTNGTLAEAVRDPHHMAAFVQCIDDVDVSLDYGTAREQDRSRNYSGAFRMAEQTLALCREHGKNASIVNALHRYNCTIQNMDDLMRLARIYDSSLRINIYRPTVNFDYVLGYSDLKDMLVHIVRNYEIESLADPLFAAVFGVSCPAGDPVARSSFRILPNGFISPSTYLLEQDWRATRIEAVHDIDELHRLDAFRKILNAPVPKECRQCPVRETCRGGVMDRRWLWYHELEQRDPYCPFKNGDGTDWISLSGEPVVSRNKKSFVHDGYLPTLIFGPRINERATDRWDRIYLQHEADYSSEVPEGIALELAEALQAKSHPRVVDLGSGYGRNGLHLLKEDFSVTFVDSSRVANDLLWEKIQREAPEADYQLRDADIKRAMCAMEDASADGVLAIHVISHGTPAEIEGDYVRQIHRVLKAGGYAAVTLPSIADKRCVRRAKAPKEGIVSFAFTDGPEADIVHSFYSEEAVRALFRKFELIKLAEIRNEGNAHWHLLLRKKETDHEIPG